MFPSQPLMRAIHADRMRQIERAGLEHRMLETPVIEIAPTMRVATAAPGRRTEVTAGPGRSNDAACGVA